MPRQTASKLLYDDSYITINKTGNLIIKLIKTGKLIKSINLSVT